MQQLGEVHHITNLCLQGVASLNEMKLYTIVCEGEGREEMYIHMYCKAVVLRTYIST